MFNSHPLGPASDNNRLQQLAGDVTLVNTPVATATEEQIAAARPQVQPHSAPEQTECVASAPEQEKDPREHFYCHACLPVCLQFILNIQFPRSPGQEPWPFDVICFWIFRLSLTHLLSKLLIDQRFTRGPLAPYRRLHSWSYLMGPLFIVWRRNV